MWCKYQQTYLFYRFRVIIYSPILIDIGTENKSCVLHKSSNYNQLKGALCLYHFVENITWYRKEINTCTLKYRGKHAMPTSWSQSVNGLKRAVLWILKVKNIPYNCILYVWIENATLLRTDSQNRKEPYSDLLT